MTQPTYEDLHGRARQEVPKPMNLPRGHWVIALRGVFKRPPKEEGKSGQDQFYFEPIEPTDDVDPSELETFSAEGRSFKDNRVVFDQWMGSWNDVKKAYDLLALMGLNVDDYADLDTAYKAAVNKRVIAYVAPDTYVHPVKGPQHKDIASGFKAIQ